jgi:hypothetical protein
MAARSWRVGDSVQIKGSGSWLTPVPVDIVDFGEKNGATVADLSDGQWAYVSDLRLIEPAGAKERVDRIAARFAAFYEQPVKPKGGR